ncbi:uncharacterized protein VTP21DRAFT_10188 [Calcarisporiella thermophila]|uniref:uncharacterized protein n=1 Tax=Calcarisporiella thermophila TaxID=911321 RepID=UPI0037445F34
MDPLQSPIQPPPLTLQSPQYHAQIPTPSLPEPLVQHHTLSAPPPPPPPKPMRTLARTSSLRSNTSNRSSAAGLASNLMFLDLPLSDPLQLLAEKHLPVEQRPIKDGGAIDKDRAGEDDYMRELIMTNSWRAVANCARYRILNTNPLDTRALLQLWHTRFVALKKIRLFHVAATEMQKVVEVVPELARPPFDTAEDRAGAEIPFELRVGWARLPAMIGDVGETIERIWALIVYCKRMKGSASDSEASRPVWEYREKQLRLMVVNYLIDLKDFSNATSQMQSLVEEDPTDVSALEGLLRLDLQLGNLDHAQSTLARLERLAGEHPSREEQGHLDLHRAFVAIGQGDFQQAKALFSKVWESNKENVLAANNLAVCELYLGHLNSALSILKELVANYLFTAAGCEPILFNLCTLYELRYENSIEKKRLVLAEALPVAGDQFGIECFKLN